MRHLIAGLLLASIAGFTLAMPATAPATWDEAACGKLADSARIDNYAKRTGCLLGQRLLQEPKLDILLDLAALHGNGKDAGPIVQSLLDHDDRDIRVAAARALGFIEYQPSAHVLVELLDHPSDTQLIWAAAESLGRMRAAASAAALQRVAASHGSPPVKQAARDALKHIADNSAYAVPSSFAFEFLAYQRVPFDQPGCGVEPPGWSLRSSESKRYSDNMPREVLMLGDSWDSEDEHVSALRVGKGWLAGIDLGEWGGELVYVEKGKQPVSILGKNVEDIHRLGDRIVVVTGLSHLGTNEGALYEVQRRRGGDWVAALWKELPGAPDSSWMTETGDLLVGVAMGHVVVTPAGTLTLVSCPSK